MANILSWLTLLALIIVPLTVVRIEKYLELRREKERRKLEIFEILMSNRARINRTSFECVRAINMVDVVFYTHTEIIKARENYLHHMNEVKAEDVNSWLITSDDLFISLLHKMSKLFGYDFDFDYLKRGIYIPKAHFDLQDDQDIMRKGLIEVLNGNKPLYIRNYFINEEAETQKQLQSSLHGLLSGKTSLKIKKDE